MSVFQLVLKMAAFFHKKAGFRAVGLKNQETISFTQKTIWMHCASLGEFEQGRPVLEALKEQYPGYPVVVSFFSPSGYEQRKNYPIADAVLYFPADTANNAKKTILRINPALVLWVKYEYWLNHLFELKRNHIPVLLISGIFRTNQPFFKFYGKLWRSALASFTHLFVQNKESLDLLKSIDINDNVSVSGDTRYDRVLQIAASAKEIKGIRTFVGESLCLVAGSTWEPDEALIQYWLNKKDSIKLIIAPHVINATHLQKLKSFFPNAVALSDLPGLTDDVISKKMILLVDSVGWLSSLYRYGHLAYIGGGFGAGIHNTLEAAVYSIPVIFGPRYKKFDEAKALLECGGGFSVKNKEDGLALWNRMTADESFRKTSGEKAGELVKSKNGACDHIIRYVQENRLLTN